MISLFPPRNRLLMSNVALRNNNVSVMVELMERGEEQGTGEGIDEAPVVAPPKRTAEYAAPCC